MPLFGKKSPEAPDWARPLTGQKYALFVTTVGEVLDAIHAGDQREAIGTGVLQLRNSAGETSSCGLQNLAQMLAMEPMAEWPRLVAEHLDNLLRADPVPQSAEEALESLRVRIWHEDYVQNLPQAIHRLLAPGIVLALVIDLPKKVMSVKADHLRMWGLTEELAWSKAEENSKQEQYEVIPQNMPHGIQLLFLLGENLYVTSHLLWLDERVDMDGDNGALVSIPTRHLLVVLPIRDIGVVKAVGGMHAAARQIFEEGPGSISAELFWWRRGRLTLLPIDSSVQPMQIKPPDDFVELLNRLAAGRES